MNEIDKKNDKPVSDEINLNDSKDTIKDLKEYGFFIENNSYWFREQSEKKGQKDYDVSNFSIKILYSLKNAFEGRYIMQLTNSDNYSEIFNISNEEFVNLNKFKAKIEPKFLFWGSIQKLEKIKRLIFKDIEPCKEITTLGYQIKEQIYAFSNGIINAQNEFKETDKYGTVTDNGITYYLPASSIINAEGESFVSEQKFKFKAGEINFEKWSELIYKSYGYNGAISLIYDISALFRDIIFRETNFFPHLFKFGVKGTAKSSQTNISMRLFGEPQTPENLEGVSTEKNLLRRLAQFRNSLNVLEEYSNKISDKMIGILKVAYDGIGYGRAQKTNDNKTTTTPILSGIIITGNDMPTVKPALFDRIILLQYEKGTEHNAYTDIEEKNFHELLSHSENGLGLVLLEILQYRDLINKKYSEVYRNLKNHLKYNILIDKNTKKQISFSPRAINNMCSILTVYLILCEKLKFPFSDEWLTNEIATNMIKQNEIVNKISETQVFWEALKQAYVDCKIKENYEFKISEKNNETLIYIRYERLYKIYKDYAERYANKALDIESLRANLKSSKSFVSLDKEDNNRDSHTIKLKNENNVSKAAVCYCFNYNEIGIDLTNTHNEISID